MTPNVLKEIGRLRAQNAEDRRQESIRDQGEMEQLILDLANNMPWNRIDAKWQDWILHLSPAAFSHFEGRVRNAATVNRHVHN